LFNTATERLSKGLQVRAKSKWTPGGLFLWLIAAVLASLVVCSQSAPDPERLPAGDEVEIELELVE
jgi:hypothetical protein